MEKFTRKLGEKYIREICHEFQIGGLKKLYTESGVGGIRVELFDEWFYTDFIKHVKIQYEKHFENNQTANRYFIIHAVNIIREYFQVGVCNYGLDGFTLTIGPLGNTTSRYFSYDKRNPTVGFGGQVRVYKVNS